MSTPSYWNTTKSLLDEEHPYSEKGKLALVPAFLIGASLLIVFYIIANCIYIHCYAKRKMAAMARKNGEETKPSTPKREVPTVVVEDASEINEITRNESTPRASFCVVPVSTSSENESIQLYSPVLMKSSEGDHVVYHPLMVQGERTSEEEGVTYAPLVLNTTEASNSYQKVVLNGNEFMPLRVAENL
ncbi:unnamed protein product [Dimorphilus gyrociliatus]|uniref:Uncharacterized protein n=1 Tax=Dimorphilus gyrociliatus TaxID=2664684 RepID=A0A7I8W9M4_9ANNE|nr:unnamed protein product [Dimorphilus gyrociliatus]